MNRTGRRRLFCGFLAMTIMAGVMFLSPLRMFAQASTPTVESVASASPSAEAAPWWKAITFNGFLSAAYSHNSNDPASHRNQLRVFDFEDGTVKLDSAEIVLQRQAVKRNELGFRIDVVAGQSLPEIEAAYGLLRDKKTGTAEHIDIQQLFGTYVIPVGKGLKVDVGKFNTHLGYEVIEGYEGYNDNYSRSFLFGYAVPFTNTGVRASYALHSKVTAMFIASNGWDDVHDNNTGKSYGFQLATTPSKATTLVVNFMEGPEQTGNNRDRRTVSELIGTWKVSSRMALGGDAIYAHEEHAANGEDAIWKGIAGYASYTFLPRFSVAFRGEVFTDGGGTRTGTEQTLHSYTITPQFNIGTKLSQISSRLKRLD